jgi:hypothetical protein
VKFCNFNLSSTDFPVVAKALCAESVARSVTGFLWLGSFLSGAVHTCMDSPNLGADCAEDTLAVVGSVGRIVIGASLLAFTCPPMSDNISAEAVAEFGFNQTDIFDCVLNSIFAANALANAIQGIFNAIKDCSSEAIRSNGLSPSGLTVANKHLCASDAVEVAASLQFLAAFIADAVSSCQPDGIDVDALCAANIIEVTSGLTTVVGRSLRMADDCDPKILNQKELNPAAA